MTLKGRHESVMMPLVVITESYNETSFEDSDSSALSYTVSFTRTRNGGYSDFFVTTNALEVTNLSPDILDFSGYPQIVRTEDFEVHGDVGYATFFRRGVSVMKAFDVGTNGGSEDFVFCESVLAGTPLKFAYDLVYAAATASAKTDYYYKTINGSPVGIGSGSGYKSVEKNTTCWASAWDFSGVPIWNSSSNSGQHGGVLVTQRHLWEAEHFQSPVGTQFKFLGTDGVLHTRISIGVNSRPTGDSLSETSHLLAVAGDIRIHTLDSPLPSSVASYPIIGMWASVQVGGETSTQDTWRSSITAANPVVVIYLDQNRRAWFTGSFSDDCKALTDVIDAVSFDGVETGAFVSGIRFSAFQPGTDFSDTLVTTGRIRNGQSGDSGSPLMYPLSGNTMAIASIFTSPVAGAFPSESRMNAIIASADSDAITRGNLSLPTGLTVTVAPDPS